MGGKGEVTAEMGEGRSDGEGEGEGAGESEKEGEGERDEEREPESYPDVDSVRLSARWYAGGGGYGA